MHATRSTARSARGLFAALVAVALAATAVSPAAQAASIVGGRGGSPSAPGGSPSPGGSGGGHDDIYAFIRDCGTFAPCPPPKPKLILGRAQPRKDNCAGGVHVVYDLSGYPLRMECQPKVRRY